MKGLVGKMRRTEEIPEGVRDLQKQLRFGIGREVDEIVKKTEKMLADKDEISDQVFELQRAYDALVENVNEALADIELNEENIVIAEKDADRKEYDKEYARGYRLGKNDMYEGKQLNLKYMDEKNNDTFAVGYRAGVAKISGASRGGRIAQ